MVRKDPSKQDSPQSILLQGRPQPGGCAHAGGHHGARKALAGLPTTAVVRGVGHATAEHRDEEAPPPPAPTAPLARLARNLPRTSSRLYRAEEVAAPKRGEGGAREAGGMATDAERRRGSQSLRLRATLFGAQKPAKAYIRASRCDAP